VRKLLLAVAVATVLPATAGAQTLTGSVGALPKGAKASVRAVDRATGVLAGRTTPSRRGAWSLRVAPGAYAVLATTVRPGRAVRRQRFFATLRAGQRRRLRSVQESGRVTPGKIAMGFERVRPSTSDPELNAAGLGIADVLINDAFDALAACDVQQIEWQRRDEVLRELEFQQSRYVDPSTRVQRDLIEPDVLVKGRLTGKGRLELRVVAVADGRTLATVTRDLDLDGFFEGLEATGRALAKEVCRLTDVYEVVLDSAFEGRFATHVGSATLRATLAARRGTGGGARTWEASGPLAWQELAFRARDPECRVSDPLPGALSRWTVTLTAAADGRLTGRWETDAQGPGESPSTSLACGDSAPIAGFPGPALIGIIPHAFTVPAEGGSVPIPNGVTEGPDGFFANGTLTVRPKGIAKRR
jgi:hypothetical protein